MTPAGPIKGFPAGDAAPGGNAFCNKRRVKRLQNVKYLKNI